MTESPNRRSAIVLYVAALNIALFGVFVGLRLAYPSDGARLQPGGSVYRPDGVIVTPFEEQSGELLSGDVVTAVEGHRLELWAEYLLCWRPFCHSFERPHWQIGDTITYSVLRDGRPVQVAVVLGRYPLLANLRLNWGELLYALALLSIGAFVFYKRPEELAARLLFLGGSSMVGATTWSFGLQVTDLIHPVLFWLHQITTYGVYLIIWCTILHFTLIFPNPHKLVQRYRWLVPLIYILPFAVQLITTTVTGLASNNTLDWLGRLTLAQNLTVTSYLLCAFVALITNYRNQPDAVSRQQIRVVVYSLGLLLVLAVLLWQVPQIVLGEQVFVTSGMMAVVGLLLPISLAVSILRYRLWNIDVIINRTVVFGLLSILIAGLYIAVVGMLSAVFQRRGSLLFSLIATGLVAVIFQPLRDRLQRFVNRLMYGERDDPYHVISRLGRQLQSTAAPEDLLVTITQTLATALKLPYASIALWEDGRFKTQTEYGIPPKEVLNLPLVYQKEIVGQLAVAPRGPNEMFTPPDMRLLEDIAHQAGSAAHTVRLNRILGRSREKLVTTREEERRRLRRDLHDGLGPTLASHTLKLDAILDLVETEPDNARKLIEELKGQTQDMVADIRRLVYELRPPALDELGLIEALEAQVFQMVNADDDLAIMLKVAPPGLPALSAAVEMAAYRISLEALTNVIRHASATICTVCFAAGDLNTLQIEITDDGTGPPHNMFPGVGISSMRERAEELGGVCTWDGPPGGGMRVTAILPLTGSEN